ncbi:hypothetical protein AT6N2_C2102 [Agrobacterium tumefaciens]|nr:hypothetical protein AT6N2_C2102 [Agrobacterium tumefaciens]
MLAEYRRYVVLDRLNEWYGFLVRHPAEWKQAIYLKFQLCQIDGRLSRMEVRAPLPLKVTTLKYL